MTAATALQAIMTVLPTRDTARARTLAGTGTDTAQQSVVITCVTLLVIRISLDIIRTIRVYDTVATAVYLTGTATGVTVIGVSVVTCFIVRRTGNIVFSVGIQDTVTTACQRTGGATAIEQARLTLLRSGRARVGVVRTQCPIRAVTSFVTCFVIRCPQLTVSADWIDETVTTAGNFTQWITAIYETCLTLIGTDRSIVRTVPSVITETAFVTLIGTIYLTVAAGCVVDKRRQCQQRLVAGVVAQQQGTVVQATGDR